MSTTTQTTREEVHPLHAAVQAAYNAGNLSAWADLYEEGALLVSTPEGALLNGPAAIRPALARFGALKGEMKVETLYALEAGGLTLLRGRFTLAYQDAGTARTMVAETVEVARRGQDGGWRFIIDHPAGAA